MSFQKFHGIDNFWWSKQDKKVSWGENDSYIVWGGLHLSMMAAWQNEDSHINTYSTYWGHAKDSLYNLEAPRIRKYKAPQGSEHSQFWKDKKKKAELAAVLQGQNAVRLKEDRGKNSSFWLTTSSSETSFQPNIFNWGLTCQPEKCCNSILQPLAC